MTSSSDSSRVAAQRGSSKARVDRDAVEAICAGRHGDPFAVLGPHPAGDGAKRGWSVRAFLPGAHAAGVLVAGAARPLPMEKIHPAGFFEGSLDAEPGAYRLKVTWADGALEEIHDAYAFPPVLTDFDLHLFSEGTHQRIYERLGARPMTLSDVAGYHFAVWAPNAAHVSIVGDFNFWDRRRFPMRPRGSSGVWELFVPGVRDGALYKYEVASRHHGYRSDRADPYGRAMTLRPDTASVTRDLDGYAWADAEWMAERRRHNALDAPMAVYEVHLGSWRRVPDEAGRWQTYREMADTLVPYAKAMGFTHIELLPVTEHPFDGSWGYQPTGYFAPTSRFGTPHDFMRFVDACHRAGLGVILDWVPAHFPDDGHALAYFDGTHLFEHEDPRLGVHKDWNTRIFNFGRNEVRNFLLASALFWLEKYHIDGLRVDAVASMLYLDYSREEGEWIPNRFGGRENLEAVEFIKKFNEIVHQAHPDVLTIAEESTAWPMVSRPTYMGGLGFDLKWNMGWMHDMLDYIEKDPIHRRYHQEKITFSLLYAFTENFMLPLSHDEVVHMKGSMISKMPGDDWQKFANLRAFYGFMVGHPGKKLLFMGGEFGQWAEWNHDVSLDWHLLGLDAHRGLQRWVRDLLHLYAAEPSLHQIDFGWEGFEWIDFRDADANVVSFLRKGRDPADSVLVVTNFSPVPRHGYRLGVPAAGHYQELLNSDGQSYGGGNVGNLGGVESDEIPHQGRPYSLALTLPPLATVYLKRERA
ncbi:MAG: 1,4-alpha-glucan branching protein GlgB [Acidobacteria bacterium]|nr:1,4-alpha-glucan branching protein GlgB [Acidobacteriota bacterium]